MAGWWQQLEKHYGGEAEYGRREQSIVDYMIENSVEAANWKPSRHERIMPRGAQKRMDAFLMKEAKARAGAMKDPAAAYRLARAAENENLHDVAAVLLDRAEELWKDLRVASALVRMAKELVGGKIKTGRQLTSRRMDVRGVRQFADQLDDVSETFTRSILLDLEQAGLGPRSSEWDQFYDAIEQIDGAVRTLRKIKASDGRRVAFQPYKKGTIYRYLREAAAQLAMAERSLAMADDSIGQYVFEPMPHPDVEIEMPDELIDAGELISELRRALYKKRQALKAMAQKVKGF